MTAVAVDVASLVALATETAKEAGELLLAHQRRDLTVETKSTATDPVSEADRAAEELIRDRLLGARPDDAFLGEEGIGDVQGGEAARRGTGLRWVVDPLDGTVNYLYGRPFFAVSIAVEDTYGPVAGVVHDPAAGETFTAGRGLGARLLSDRRGAAGGVEPLRVTDVATLAQTLVATGYAYDVEVRRDWATHVADLLGEARDMRRCGVASLDLAWVAAGRVDAYLEFGLQPWDWAAGMLLVREAGGVADHVQLELAGQDHTGVLAGGEPACTALEGWLAGRR